MQSLLKVKRAPRLDLSRRPLADQVEAGRTGNPIVYLGLRGMGKTSLMYAARDLFRERGWLAGYFEVRRNVEPGVAVQTIVADSAQLSTGKLRAGLAAGGHRIGGMKLALSPAGFSFAVDADKRAAGATADPFPALVAFLRALGADARANGVGVALLIDELQLFRKRDARCSGTEASPGALHRCFRCRSR